MVIPKDHKFEDTLHFMLTGIFSREYAESGGFLVQSEAKTIRLWLCVPMYNICMIAITASDKTKKVGITLPIPS